MRLVSSADAGSHVPWWGVVSAVCAPIVLVVGWATAAELQPRYDWILQTVSVLASPGAADRWVMSWTFLLVGTLDVVTALALRPAVRLGRIILIFGAISGMLVAANPEPTGGSSDWHAFFAGIGLVALTVWPIAAAHWHSRDNESALPWALRPTVATWAAVVTAVLFGWFLIELVAGLPQLGVAERALGQAQALWPLIVVVSCRRHWPAAPDADRAGGTGHGYARSHVR